MYQFTIHLPHDEVEREIQRRCSYRRWPSSLFGAAYQPGILHGGKLRKGFWLAGWKEGTFGTGFRYFAYRLIPQGAQTVIRGKFVYPLDERLFPYCACVMAIIFVLRHWDIFSSTPSRMAASVVVCGFPFLFQGALNKIDTLIPLSKRWETLVLDYLTKLEHTYPAEPSDADGDVAGEEPPVE